MTVQGKAPNTVKAYLREVEQFGRWSVIAGQGEDGIYTATFANESCLTAYLAHMRSTRKPAGVALAVAALKAWFKFLAVTGVRQNSPVPADLCVSVKVQEPTTVPSIPEFLIMRRYMESDGLRRMGLTGRALFELLAGSGLRIEAALDLRRKNLHLDGPRPHVLITADTVSCKGRTAGTVPLTPFASAMLGAHLVLTAPDPETKLFPFNYKTAWKIIRRVSLESGVGRTFSPHSLRHLYCAAMYFRDLDGGQKDIVWVRNAAGHSNVSTTDKYVRAVHRVVHDDAQWEAYAYGATA